MFIIGLTPGEGHVEKRILRLRKEGSLFGDVVIQSCLLVIGPEGRVSVGSAETFSASLLLLLLLLLGFVVVRISLYVTGVHAELAKRINDFSYLSLVWPLERKTVTSIFERLDMEKWL